MIVPAMTSRELTKEIKIDGYAVDRKACIIAEKLRRTAIKKRFKPLEMWFEYKSSRQNNWLIFIRHYGNKGVKIYLFAWFVSKHGINIVFAENDAESRFYFHHYTSHFFKRYNERFLKEEIPVIDSFKRYFVRNMDMNCKTGGGFESDIMGIVNDGVIFGTVKKEPYTLYVTYKTFISNEMILDFQKQDIQLIEDFKNGKIIPIIY
jgi:hypothetical protein